jgi:hypothetical protein
LAAIRAYLENLVSGRFIVTWASRRLPGRRLAQVNANGRETTNEGRQNKRREVADQGDIGPVDGADLRSYDSGIRKIGLGAWGTTSDRSRIN